jgi:chemotaxis protein CheD
MDSPVVVGISDMNVTTKPGVLVTYALGSCVGICLYDRAYGISGLSHILLPDSSMCPNDKNVMKFADTAVKALLEKMERVGASRLRITAKIAGGARLFGGDGGIQIGDRNVAAVKEQLSRFRIPLVAEDTGLDYGRTLEFHSQDGVVHVKTALKGPKTI